MEKYYVTKKKKTPLVSFKFNLFNPRRIKELDSTN